MILREAILKYGPGRRVPGSNRIRGSLDVVQVCQDLRDEVQEHFCVLLLITKNQILGRFTAAVGPLNEVAVHPREIFLAAIQAGAAAVVLVHNHPSGDSTPSPQDDQITEKLRKIGNLIGIPVLDHVVLGVEDTTATRNNPSGEIHYERSRSLQMLYTNTITHTYLNCLIFESNPAQIQVSPFERKYCYNENVKYLVNNKFAVAFPSNHLITFTFLQLLQGASNLQVFFHQ